METEGRQQGELRALQMIDLAERLRGASDLARRLGLRTVEIKTRTALRRAEQDLSALAATGAR